MAALQQGSNYFMSKEQWTRAHGPWEDYQLPRFRADSSLAPPEATSASTADLKFSRSATRDPRRASVAGLRPSSNFASQVHVGIGEQHLQDARMCGEWAQASSDMGPLLSEYLSKACQPVNTGSDSFRSEALASHANLLAAWGHNSVADMSFHSTLDLQGLQHLSTAATDFGLPREELHSPMHQSLHCASAGQPSRVLKGRLVSKEALASFSAATHQQPIYLGLEVTTNGPSSIAPKRTPTLQDSTPSNKRPCIRAAPGEAFRQTAAAASTPVPRGVPLHFSATAGKSKVGDLDILTSSRLDARSAAHQLEATSPVQAGKATGRSSFDWTQQPTSVPEPENMPLHFATAAGKSSNDSQTPATLQRGTNSAVHQLDSTPPARQATQATGRAILGWTQQTLASLVATKVGKQQVSAESALGRAAADLGFVPVKQPRRRVQRQLKAALQPQGQILAAAQTAASALFTETAARVSGSIGGFRVLSAPHGAGPPFSPAANASLANRALAACCIVPAFKPSTGNRHHRSRIRDPFGSEAHHREDRGQKSSTDDEAEVSSRSDESSVQTVACGPPANARGASSSIIVLSPERSPERAARKLRAPALPAPEIDDGECSRSRCLSKACIGSPTAQRLAVGLHLSRESLAAAEFLATKHSTKTLKLSVQRTRRQVCIPNLHTAWKQSRLKMYRFVVRPSKISGLGVYSTEDIEEGELLMEYCGEIIRRPVADIREKHGSSNGIYFFALSNDFVIDATHNGGIARFINHCCQYDYCLSEAEDGKHVEKNIQCVCGAAQCRGVL